MKILFCTGSMRKGGAERVISNLTNYLSRDNNELYIITSINTKTEYTLNKNIGVYHLDGIVREKNKLKRIKKRRKKLKEIINNIRPDIIITFLPEPTFMVMSLRRKIRCPIIISERNDPSEEYKSFIYKFLMRKYYKKADGFIFQTEGAKEYFSKNIQNKSVIIENPINKEFLIRNNNVKKKDIIISTGRLTAQKNQKMLISAFSEITDIYPHYKLIIYGEGDLRNELEMQIKRLGLENKVFLPGVVNNIKEKMEESKIFVLSSNYEGMPNALMEAMALGLPVISTDCPSGGPNYLIENRKTGVLVPIKNVEKLKKAIINLIEDKKMSDELGKNAAKKMKELNPDIINEKWKKYIYKILEENKR